MLSFPGDIYVKNLTFTLYCGGGGGGGVCVGGGGNQGVARLVLTGCGIIRSHSRRFVMMCFSSYICAPNRISSLLIVNGRKSIVCVSKRIQANYS